MIPKPIYTRYNADDNCPILKPLMRYAPPGTAEMELNTLTSGDGIPLITGRIHDGYVCMTISEAQSLHDQLGKALAIAKDFAQNNTSFGDD